MDLQVQVMLWQPLFLILAPTTRNLFREAQPTQTLVFQPCLYRRLGKHGRSPAGNRPSWKLKRNKRLLGPLHQDLYDQHTLVGHIRLVIDATARAINFSVVSSQLTKKVLHSTKTPQMASQNKVISQLFMTIISSTLISLPICLMKRRVEMNRWALWLL